MDNLLNLPKTVTLLDGRMVDITSAVWRIQAHVDGGKLFRFNWNIIQKMTSEAGTPIFADPAFHLMRIYIADCLQRRKPSTAHVYFSSFIKFGRWLQESPPSVTLPATGFFWQQYDEAVARAFHRWGIETTASNGDFFRHLRIFYRWGVARRHTGFSLTRLRFFDDMKAKMHPVGHHVRYRHPTEGPFSDAEKQLLLDALHREVGEPQQRILVMILLELGIRPRAAVLLRNRHLHQFDTPQEPFFQLDVPRLKQRQAKLPTRRRPISTPLGRLLVTHQQRNGDGPLLHWLGHKTPEARLRDLVKQWVKQAEIISPRTGELLKCNPRRFRYTLATHFAQQGASKVHLATLLGHSDLKYVSVYTATTPGIAATVADATDAALQPVVSRFLGQIADTPKVAQPVIPVETPHISLPVLNVGGIGQCGRDVEQHGLCQKFPPLSCYQCASFIAWRAAPHALVLDNLKQFVGDENRLMDDHIRTQLSDTAEAVAGLLAQLGEIR